MDLGGMRWVRLLVRRRKPWMLLSLQKIGAFIGLLCREGLRDVRSCLPPIRLFNGIRLARTDAGRPVQEAHPDLAAARHRPEFQARVPRCGHGRRSLGSRKFDKAAAA
jgi:hypothetical protein